MHGRDAGPLSSNTHSLKLPPSFFGLLLSMPMEGISQSGLEFLVLKTQQTQLA